MLETRHRRLTASPPAESVPELFACVPKPSRPLLHAVAIVLPATFIASDRSGATIVSARARLTHGRIERHTEAHFRDARFHRWVTGRTARRVPGRPTRSPQRSACLGDPLGGHRWRNDLDVKSAALSIRSFRLSKRLSREWRLTYAFGRSPEVRPLRTRTQRRLRLSLGRGAPIDYTPPRP